MHCENMVLVIEDLDILFFHGSGKRNVGWDNFFLARRENSWFINAIHKALSDLAKHRGMYIFEINKNGTSITCIICGHKDSDNRKGEHFACLKCGVVLNTDRDVATENILRVALLGNSLRNASAEVVNEVADPLAAVKPDNHSENHGVIAIESTSDDVNP